MGYQHWRLCAVCAGEWKAEKAEELKMRGPVVKMPPLPTIHRNGTSAEALFDQALCVMDAARKLLEALIDAWPNSRDYYVQGPSAIAEAEAYWRRAQAEVVRIRNDAEALASHCQESAR